MIFLEKSIRGSNLFIPLSGTGEGKGRVKVGGWGEGGWSNSHEIFVDHILNSNLYIKLLLPRYYSQCGGMEGVVKK